MTTLLPLRLFRSSCAIRPCRMPHLHFIYKIYHTAHAANVAYVRSMYTPRLPPPSPCAIRVCIWQGRRLHDRQLRVHYFICTLCLSAFQTFILRGTFAALARRRYCRLQITVNNRTANICPHLFAEPQANQLRASLAAGNLQLAAATSLHVASS